MGGIRGYFRDFLIEDFVRVGVLRYRSIGLLSNTQYQGLTRIFAFILYRQLIKKYFYLLQFNILTIASSYILNLYNLYNSVLTSSIIRSGEKVYSRNFKYLLNTFINITGEAEAGEYQAGFISSNKLKLEDSSVVTRDDISFIINNYYNVYRLGLGILTLNFNNRSEITRLINYYKGVIINLKLLLLYPQLSIFNSILIKSLYRLKVLLYSIIISPP